MQQARMAPVMELFLDILIGDLDNRNQIRAEQKSGEKIHPYAKHITRDITDRIDYFPESFPCRFVLEESYYIYPGKAMEVKPLLFQLFVENQDTIRLHSKKVPESINPLEFVNANTDWTLKFYELEDNPSFKPAHYKLQPNGSFKVNHPNDLGNGMKFTLIETLSAGRLEVMELLEKDGVRITPYNTPLIYEPII